MEPRSRSGFLSHKRRDDSTDSEELTPLEESALKKQKPGPHDDPTPTPFAALLRAACEAMPEGKEPLVSTPTPY